MGKRKKKSYGLRLRTRGGATLRKQWTRVMSIAKSKHRCPSCSSKSVRRVGVGIWSCAKCGYRFAGGAYQPSTKIGQASMRIS